MTMDQLKAFGADTEQGLSRCMGREDFYLRMVHAGVEDPHFASLEKNLAKNDLQAAFEDAHALKGVMATLALTPLSEPVAEMTEHLRNREEMDYGPLMTRVLALKKKLADLE